MVENERWKAEKLKAETMAIEDKTAPEVDKLEAEADALDAKARRDDAMAETDSLDKEVKNELQRAKILADIEKGDKDRQQMKITNQSKEKADAQKPVKKGNVVSDRQKRNAGSKKKT